MSRTDQFNAIDTDGDGFITARELLASMSTDPETIEAFGLEQTVAEVVAMADQDGDKKLTLKGYERLFNG